MSFDAILAAIEASGAQEVAQVRAERDAHAGRLLAEAEDTARARREAARRAARWPAAGECARLWQAAKLEALRIVGEAREALVTQALTETRQRLAGLRAEADYPLILRRLTEEALAGLGGERCGRLEVDPHDEVLLRCVLSDLGFNWSIAPTLDSWGGLIAYSEDDRVVVTNTLEARFERAQPILQRELAALFESETETPPEVKDEARVCPASTMATPACTH